MLPRGEWDPERRGGVLDHWRIRTHRRERVRVYEEVEPKSRLNLGFKVAAADEDELAVEASLDSNDTSLLHLLQGNNPEGAEEERRTEDDPNAMRLCVKDGKCIPLGLSSSLGNGSESVAESDEATPNPTTRQSENNDPQAMRWCIKNGVRVSPSPKAQQEPNQDTAPMLLDPPQITVLASQTVISPEPIRTSEKHAPKTRSPLSRTFMIPSATVRLRSLIHGPGDTSPGGSMASVGRARRKFTSMMF